MESAPPRIYRFSRFRLDAAERSLFEDGQAVQLPPKAFDTLLLLIENAGRVLSKERMLAEIWEGSFVEENNLAQNISLLRRTLGESDGAKFIETVPKFGYRFVVDVSDETPSVDVIERTRARVYIDDGSGQREIPSGATSTVSTDLLLARLPETHYVQSGEVNIAYQVIGEGDIDIVFVMGWVSHLEYFWKHHLFASFLDRLASFSRLILFDKRGTGLSDRVPINELPTLEQRMEDVHAVMDAVGSERAVLIGVSEGGPMCSLFAATYPERTSALVMIGTYAKRIRDDDYPWAPSAEQRGAFIDLVKTDWGKPVGIEDRAPSMAGDQEFREWWATYLRMGASPGAAVALTTMNAEIDVRNVLPLVRVPTLVIHRVGDLCLKVEEGRYVASKIPGSRYVELPGDDHLPFVGDQEKMLDEIEHFVTGMQSGESVDRVLATVMNVLVNGHGADTDDLDAALASARRQFEIFNGREIASNNGRLVAAFDGPARAIRCAAAIERMVVRGLEPKIGIHTGECDRVGDDYSGFAVDLADRIAERASGGQILVSRTVKDLVAGSGIDFEDMGVESFDDLDGEWRLFVVRL